MKPSKKIHSFLLGLICLQQYATFSQNLYNPNVQVSVQYPGVVYKGKEIKGYAYIENKEMADSKNATVTVVFLSPSCKEIARQDLTLPADTIISNFAYNGQTLFLYTGDIKGKKTECFIFNKTGDLILKTDPKQAIYGEVASITAVYGQGFLLISKDKINGLKLKLEFYNNSGNKVWEKSSENINLDHKLFEMYSVMTVNGDIITLELTRGEKRNVRKAQKYYVAYSITDGRKCFEITALDSGLFYEVTQTKFNPDTRTYVLKGSLYKGEQNYIPVWDEQVKAIFAMEIDLSGNVLVKSTCLFDKSLYDQLSEVAIGNHGRPVIYSPVSFFENGNALIIATFYEGRHKSGKRDTMNCKFLRPYNRVLFEMRLNDKKMVYSQLNAFPSDTLWRQGTLLNTTETELAGRLQRSLSVCDKILPADNPNAVIILQSKFYSRTNDRFIRFESDRKIFPEESFFKLVQYSSGGKITRDALDLENENSMHREDTECVIINLLKSNPGTLTMVVVLHKYKANNVYFKHFITDFK